MTTSPRREWTLRCDGGARGNPGPGALGFVLTDPSGAEVEAHGEYLGHVTNNVAEYRALIAGLEAALRHHATPLCVALDSELVVRQMTGQYRVKNAGLKPLHERAKEVQRKLGPVRWTSVPREDNHRADELVNQALDRAQASESSR